MTQTQCCYNCVRLFSAASEYAANWRFLPKWSKIKNLRRRNLSALTGTAREFRVTAEEINGSTVLLCHGRLTNEVSDHFKQQVKQLLAARKPIILDLGGVKQMDSSGLGALVSLWVSSKSAGCPLHFYNLSAPVKRLLGTTHVLKAFESCGSHLTRLP